MIFKYFFCINNSPLMQDATFVRSVHAVAVEASCLSLRGTACYTLGLFSRHRAG